MFTGPAIKQQNTRGLGILQPRQLIPQDYFVLTSITNADGFRNKASSLQGLLLYLIRIKSELASYMQFCFCLCSLQTLILKRKIIMNGKAIGLLGIFSSFSQIFNSVYGSLHLVDDPFFFFFIQFAGFFGPHQRINLTSKDQFTNWVTSIHCRDGDHSSS